MARNEARPPSDCPDARDSTLEWEREEPTRPANPRLLRRSPLPECEEALPFEELRVSRDVLLRCLGSDD